LSNSIRFAFFFSLSARAFCCASSDLVGFFSTSALVLLAAFFLGAAFFFTAAFFLGAAFFFTAAFFLGAAFFFTAAPRPSFWAQPFSLPQPSF
jgi:hypothetical protein